MSKRIRRVVARINRERQLELLPSGGEDPITRSQAPREGSSNFIDPDPNEILIGSGTLSSHLKSMGITDAFVVREVVRGLAYTGIESKYCARGRRGYAPASMVGLVLYGLLHGISSLRSLERFSRSDLGCMWVSGGNTPDHSIIGRFINAHAQELSEVLFEGVVEEVLRRTGGGRESVAGDGTIIEAMSSRYGVLKEEAAQEQLSALRSQGEGESAQARRLEEMVEVLQGRRRDNGGRGHRHLNPREPEAAVLKQKGGSGSRPSYVPVVLANDERVVVDAEVDSTQEIRAMEQLLDRQGTQIEELLLDAGLRASSVIEKTLKEDISLLMPAYGGEAGKSAKEPKYFSPSRFLYDEARDVYICPAAELLEREATYRKKQRTRYGTPACLSCTLHDQCTQSKRRTIERTRATELTEALAQVMRQERARERYAYRKAMVESVFSVLRDSQGLNRFHRRGLAGARLEFRLQIMAYNLSRAVARALASILRPFWLILSPLSDAQAIGSNLATLSATHRA